MSYGINSIQKKSLESKYLGKRVKVIINDPYHPINKEGMVICIDDLGQLHGTWGGLAAIPGEDEIEVIE